MSSYDIKTHLKTLSETHAVSGYEAPVRAVLTDAWQGMVDTFDQDGLGSLVGIKRATRPNPHNRKIMLAAHMDEIGLMVRDIVDGFLLVHRVAGLDNRVMMAQPVLVHGKRLLRGVVAAIPPHLQEPNKGNTYAEFDQFIVDVGLPDEAVRQLVRIGDMITPDTPFMELANSLVAGKAFDDRACVAAMTVCLHELSNLNHAWDVYAVATVQEENGLYGAQTAAQHVNPEVAIALDVTFAAQSGVPQDSQSDIGSGAVISMGANFHPKLFDALVACAKANEIKYQVDVLPAYSGTDAWAIQVAREGIPTALLSLPIRNMHSPNETCDWRDIERMGRLLARFIASLEDSFLGTLAL